MNSSKHHKSGKKFSRHHQQDKSVKPAAKNTSISPSVPRVSVDELFTHFTANIIKEDTLFTR